VAEIKINGNINSKSAKIPINSIIPVIIAEIRGIIINIITKVIGFN
jgi:hypothetical protein